MHKYSYNELVKVQNQSDKIKLLVKDIPHGEVRFSDKGNIVEFPEYYGLYITSIELRVNEPNAFQSFSIEQLYNSRYTSFIATKDTINLYKSDKDNFVEVFSNQYSPLKYKDGMRLVFNQGCKNMIAGYSIKMQLKDLRELEKQNLINEHVCLFQFYKSWSDNKYYNVKNTIKIENSCAVVYDLKSTGFLQNILFKFSEEDEFDNIESIVLCTGVERKEMSKHECKKLAEDSNLHRSVYYVPFQLGYLVDASIVIRFSKPVKNTVEYYLCEKNILISIDGKLVCRYCP